MESITRYRIVAAHLAFTLLLSLVSSVARAELISLDPIASGWISESYNCTPAFCYSDYDSNNPLDRMIHAFPTQGGMSSSTTISKGFLVFDLSSVSFTSSTASLVFNLDHGAELVVTSVKPAKAQALTTIPAGPVEAKAYDALYGTPEDRAAYMQLSSRYATLENAATVLGTLSNGRSSPGTYTIRLNGTALDRINNSDNLFAVGIERRVHGQQTLLEQPGVVSLTFNGAPQLLLTPHSVPLPAWTWVLSSALLTLIAARHRQT